MDKILLTKITNLPNQNCKIENKSLTSTIKLLIDD